MLSFKIALPLLISLLVLSSVAIISAVFYVRANGAVSNLALQNLTHVHDRISDRLEDYLEFAERVNRVNLQIIEAGMLDRNNLPAWRGALFEQIKAFETISSILWGDAEGNAIFVSRYPETEGFRYGIRDPSIGENGYEYFMDETGKLSETPIVEYMYDPRVRPWYDTAMSSGEPVWADIYTWVAKAGRDPVLSVPFVAPLVDGDGKVQGVMDVEFSLYDLGRFLRTLSIGKTGLAYIMDGRGYLVASSTDTPILAGGSGERVLGEESGHALIAESARAVADSFIRRDTMAQRFHMTLRAGEDNVLLMSTPFRRAGNLRWLAVTLIPENDFLGEIKAGRRHGIIIASTAVLVALAAGILLALYMAGPIVALADHVRRIGRGHLDSEIEIRGFPEFVRLSAAINRMTEGLKERMKLRESLAMAMEVQQRLLPAATPQVPGLDVAGHSDYCDETGGDYYDYLEIARQPGESAVIAIGDVSGHGIASAMVMASARGVLRSRSSDASSLADLLNHMNRQITEDSSGGRFMTMLLTHVNAVRRQLRWASAGHRAPIIYDPARNSFFEPDGGDVPLGVVADCAFSEYEFRDLRKGQIVLLATDGLWEASNEAGETFGLVRIKAVIRHMARHTADRIRTAIVDAVDEFRDGAVQNDDITFVIIKLTS